MGEEKIFITEQKEIRKISFCEGEEDRRWKGRNNCCRWTVGGNFGTIRKGPP